MSSLGILAVVTVSVSLLSIVPQVLRATRSRVTDGLSPASVLLTLAMFTLWGTYGIGIGDWAQIINNVAGTVLFLVLARVLAVEVAAVRPWHAPAVVGVVGAVAASGAIAFSPMAAAAAGTALGLVTKVPQVKVAVSGQPLWGLDPWAVILGLVTAMLWLVYGVASGDVAVVVSSIIGVALQGVIVARRLPARRTLHSLAGGRLGDQVAAMLAPLAQRVPYAVVD